MLHGHEVFCSLVLKKSFSMDDMNFHKYIMVCLYNLFIMERCCLAVQGSTTVRQPVVSVESSSLLLHSIKPWLIC